MSPGTLSGSLYEQSADNNDELLCSGIQCVRQALIESRLIEFLLIFRYSELTDNHISTSAQLSRTQAMLNLKQASEKFNQLLIPVDENKRNALRKLNLETITSNGYWHALFIECRQPGQGEPALEQLYTKLLSTKNNFPVEAKAIDRTGINESQRYALAASGFVAGASILGLAWLAVSAFWPDFSVNSSFISLGSTNYRLIMIVVLLMCTVSIFLTISKLSEPRNPNNGVVVVDNNRKSLLAEVFAIGASRRRVSVGALGPLLLGLGSGISISAGFGTFGFSVLLDGLYKTFQVPFWLSQSIITVLCYGLAWVWARVPLGLGTLTTLLLIGPSISLGVGMPPENLGFIGNLFAFVIGLFMFAAGISCAAAAALGPDGITALSLAAERNHHWPVARATLLWDSTAIAAGIILGGNFGIATLIGLLTVPYLIHLFVPPLRRLLH